mgnify:CR=1 FL=1
MPTKESIQRKKEFARLLYTMEGVTTQKELAGRTGVSEQTISKWVREENWKQFRASVIITKEEELKRLYNQVVELNDAIEQKEPGQRYATSREADTITKLTSAIRQLETDTSVSDALSVLKDFIIFVREDDPNQALELTSWADAFVRTLIK